MNPSVKEQSAHHVMGQTFRLQDETYTIVDTRNIDGEVMIYAKPEGAAKGPLRAAFRLRDVQDQLLTPNVA